MKYDLSYDRIHQKVNQMFQKQLNLGRENTNKKLITNNEQNLLD